MNIYMDECGEFVAQLECTPEQAEFAYNLIVAEGCAWHNEHPGYVHPGAPVNFDYSPGEYAYFLPEEGPTLGVLLDALTNRWYLELHVTPRAEGDDRLDGTMPVLEMSTDDFLAMRNAFRWLLGMNDATA
jgi:hypothetical protein